MHSPFDPKPQLAPLQRVMLQNTFKEPTAGHHVEQVEIVFAPTATKARIFAAWRETVEQTAALQISFTLGNGQPQPWDFVSPPVTLHHPEPLTGSVASWLEADQLRPLLTSGEVPWRAVFWPETRRFVWTFHHALLDGRSITRILRNFLKRIDSSHPEYLTLSRWQPATAEGIALAETRFSKRVPPSIRFPVAEPDSTPAVHCLGQDFGDRLESSAVEMAVTVAAILTWSWGQAILAASTTDAVWVEQLRSGAPQPGTAGFSMNLLPVLIHAKTNLTQFGKQLLDLRAIETVSPEDFPPGVFPDTRGPWASVIMVERGSLHQMALASDSVEILKLHERKAETLVATAYIMPDLRLEVEGPGRHALLAGWIESLEKLKN